jgi:hypothetical protein
MRTLTLTLPTGDGQTVTLAEDGTASLPTVEHQTGDGRTRFVFADFPGPLGEPCRRLGLPYCLTVDWDAAELVARQEDAGAAGRVLHSRIAAALGKPDEVDQPLQV